MRKNTYYIRRTFLLIFLILLVLAVITPMGRRCAAAVAAPFAALGHTIADGIRFILPGTASHKDTVAELQSENQLLKSMLAETDGIRRENAALRKAAGLPLPPMWNTVAAQIIARDPERWRETFTINRGYEDGVKTGAAVVVNGYFAGRILECHRHSASVATIFSSQCSISVHVGNAENMGVLQGDGSGNISIKYLPREFQPVSGVNACTSGMGGWMPSGIPVARPAQGKDGSPLKPIIIDTAFCEATFIPLANITATDIVSVIVPETGK